MHSAWVTLFLFLWFAISALICKTAYLVYGITGRCAELLVKGGLEPSWIPFLRGVGPTSKLPRLFDLFFNGLTGGPLRLASFFLCAVLAGVCSLVLPGSALVMLTRLLSRIAMHALNIRLVEHGRRASRSEASYIVSNHVSFVDVLGLLSRGCSFVAKDSVRDIPCVGRVASAIGCIFVARDSKESRQSARDAIFEHFQTVKQWSQLVIFPEGTITNGEGLLQFRRGGFEACMPVQPVRIEYSNLQVSMSLINTFELLCFLCCMPRTEMHLHYLPVMTGGNAEELASQCREAIATVKGLRALKLYGLESFRDERECSRFVKKDVHHTDNN